MPTTTAPEIQAAPPDLDVAGLQRAIGCLSVAKDPGKDLSRACEVLARVESCSALPTDSDLPADEQRYVGHATRVVGGAAEGVVALARLRRVPQPSVGPGQLPFRIGIAVVDRASPANRDLGELATALDGGQLVTGPAGLKAVEQHEAWPEAFATRTARGHAYIIAHGGGYACQGKRGELVIVQRAASRTSPIDGVYAWLLPARSAG